MESNTGKISQKELENFNYLLETDNEIELWGHSEEEIIFKERLLLEIHYTEDKADLNNSLVFLELTTCTFFSLCFYRFFQCLLISLL